MYCFKDLTSQKLWYVPWKQTCIHTPKKQQQGTSFQVSGDSPLNNHAIKN